MNLIKTLSLFFTSSFCLVSSTGLFSCSNSNTPDPVPPITQTVYRPKDCKPFPYYGEESIFDVDDKGICHGLKDGFNYKDDKYQGCNTLYIPNTIKEIAQGSVVCSYQLFGNIVLKYLLFEENCQITTAYTGNFSYSDFSYVELPESLTKLETDSFYFESSDCTRLVFKMNHDCTFESRFTEGIWDSLFSGRMEMWFLDFDITNSKQFPKWSHIRANMQTKSPVAYQQTIYLYNFKYDSSITEEEALNSFNLWLWDVFEIGESPTTLRDTYWRGQIYSEN